MQKFHTLLLALVFLTASATAQPDTLWTRTFGGSDDDYGWCVEQTLDGGYIIVGSTHSFGGGLPNIYLIKTDTYGDTVWTRIFGGNFCDFGSSVQQTTDGGYIIAGETSSFGAGDMDVYLIKTDANGNEIWTRTYGGNGRDAGNCVQQTRDGGYIITCETWSYGAGEEDIYLIKTDDDGNTLWTKTFGGFNCDEGLSVQQTSDWGYIIAGGTNSFTVQPWHYDVYLIKTNANGDTLWTRTYGGSHSDIGNDVQQTSDGGYIIAGGTVSYGAGSFDIYLIKTDPVGDTLWTRTYGGSNSEEGYGVQQTQDRGYIISGYTYSYGAGDKDIYLIKTDAYGDIAWTKNIGGSSGDRGYSVQQTPDGGYITAGWTESFGAGAKDVYLIRLEAEPGNIAVTLYPHNPPIQIPSSGGSFEFDIEITNSSSIACVVDIAIDAILPAGMIYPILLRPEVALAAGAVIERDNLTQFVPGRAPAGDYTYSTSVFDHETGQLLAEDSFPFEKLAGIDTRGGDWSWALFGWEEDPDQLSQAAPVIFALNRAYPNPFNPRTAIRYQLAAVSFVNLSVYDVTGRLVAELVDGWREAGNHEVTFDGSNLASGIYIYRLEAGHFKASGKMVLVK